MIRQATGVYTSVLPRWHADLWRLSCDRCCAVAATDVCVHWQHGDVDAVQYTVHCESKTYPSP